MFQQSVKNNAATKSTKSMFKKPPSPSASGWELPIPNKMEQNNEEECIEFICLPEKPKSGTKDSPNKVIKCPDPECPKGYEIILDNELNLSGKCAKYRCEPLPQNDAVCNITGRTFSTFDGTEFKYDICNHLLARDLTADNWSITIVKNCTYGNYVCKKELKINDKESDLSIVLFTDLTLQLNGYRYAVDQLQKSTYVKMNSFVVSKVGNTIVFVSHVHGFWVIFDEFGDVKIGVTAKYSTKVDGLCGYFNGNSGDDKRLPSGESAESTVDFGDGWFADAETERLHCEPHACPKDMQDKAWEMCNTVRHESFDVCSHKRGGPIDTDRFISKCLETACDCLLMGKEATTTNSSVPTASTIKSCKCSMLQNYAADCLAATDDSIHLDTWRSVHDCPADCPPGMVQNDCYSRRCEPTCDTLAADDCPHLPGTCFSGCYCPAGTVRKNDGCVPISECRDCVCDGFGNSKYVTYDRSNFSIDTNCTYLLSRDMVVTNVHTFQVYVTLGRCDRTEVGPKSKKKSSSTATCTQSLHILYGPHIVHLQRKADRRIQILVDGIEVNQLPLKKNWIYIVESTGIDLQIKLPESQVELTATFEDMSFAIRVPSVKYGSKMEGLCGDCNGIAADDLQPNPNAKNKPPKKAETIKDIVQTWLADDPALPNEELCLSEETAEQDCIPLPPEQDPCFIIMDEDAFGRCHAIVDPIMYLSTCQIDMCRPGPNQQGACQSVAAYAKECLRNDVCVDWKRGLCAAPDTCPPGMIYQSCGCARTCETSAAAKLIPIKLTNDYCAVPKSDGCFCPDGKVQHNGTCIPEAHCTPCDDRIHYPGDVWHPDRCTECKCSSDSNTQCTKSQCSLMGKICDAGWKQIVIDDKEQCCPIFKCVPEPTKKPTAKCPPSPPLPDCAADQQNKQFMGRDGCARFICECKPFDQCPPLVIHTLKPGEKMVTDTTGCCPVHKIVCDKSKCPAKPLSCDQEFYEVTKVTTNGLMDSLDADECCAEYKCAPPKDKCLVVVDGKKTLKSPGDKWPTQDACLTKLCVWGPAGETKEQDEIEQCPRKVCDPGHELKASTVECCGKCVQTKCLMENNLHALGDQWKSADNCTTFKCIEMNDVLIVTSMVETCPNVTDCPANLRYMKGCCQLCKEIPQEQSMKVHLTYDLYIVK